MRSLLVTSAGSGVGQAVFNALKYSPHTYRLVVLNSHPLSSIFQHADAAYLSPETAQQEAFASRLTTIITQEKPDLILAGRDEELPILAKLRSEIEALGSRVPGPNTELSLSCTDKYLTWKQLGHLLPVTETAFTSTEIEALLKRWGFPVLVKPRRGFASRGVLVVHTRALLEAFLAEAQEPYIVQPYLSQTTHEPHSTNWPEQSGQIVIGARGQILGVFASQVRIAQGLTTHLQALAPESPFAQELYSMATVMARHGFRGAYNIQGITTPQNGFQLIEMNARCTGLTGVRAQMGFNEVDMLYDSYVAGSTPDLNFGSLETAVMETQFSLLPNNLTLA